MTEFLIVQHAGDFQDIKYTDGQFDPTIGPKGIERAKALRERLAPKRIDAIYASPLRRSHDTAKVLAEGRNLPLCIRDDLKEVFLGDMEPRHHQFNDLMQAGKDPVVVQFLETRSWDAIPGGESDRAFRDRCRKAIDEIAAQWPDQTVLVVGHGASINAIVAEMLHTPSAIIFYPENCSLTVFKLRGGVADFLLLNDCRDRDVLYEHRAPIFSME